MTQMLSNDPSNPSGSLVHSGDNAVLALPEIERDYKNLFNQISALQENDLICRSNCKFCNHPARAEAEMKWESSGNSFAMVEKFFSQYSESHPEIAKLTYQNIKSHIWNHYKAQERKIYLREYGERLQEFINYKVNKVKMLEGMLAILEMHILETASDPAIDKVKKGDALTKMMKTQTDILAMQAKLSGEVDGVAVTTERFMTVWLHLINRQKDENLKRLLHEALNEFQSGMEGVDFGV